MKKQLKELERAVVRQLEEEEEMEKRRKKKRKEKRSVCEGFGRRW